MRTALHATFHQQRNVKKRKQKVPASTPTHGSGGHTHPHEGAHSSRANSYDESWTFKVRCKRRERRTRTRERVQCELQDAKGTTRDEMNAKSATAQTALTKSSRGRVEQKVNKKL